MNLSLKGFLQNSQTEFCNVFCRVDFLKSIICLKYELFAIGGNTRMLRIDRKTRNLTRLQNPRLPEAGIQERYDLQQMIRNCSDAFFQEIGEKLLLVGEEVQPSNFVEDRIDLLAVDQEGASVVLELKRSGHKLQLLQALSYAGMIAKWSRDDFIQARQRLTGKPVREVEEDMEQFLLENAGNVNELQRVILIAEDFDYEVLITAEWLNENYDVDIRCYRLVLSVEDEREFLNCMCIFPPPEITQHTIRRKRCGTSRQVSLKNWDDALASIANPAVVDFFQYELDNGRENYLQHRNLYFRKDGKRRFFIGARRDNAYVWQYDRFENDIAFWQEKIGLHIEVQPVNSEQSLRFILKSKEDFTRFIETFNGEFQKVLEDGFS